MAKRRDHEEAEDHGRRPAPAAIPVGTRELVLIGRTMECLALVEQWNAWHWSNNGMLGVERHRDRLVNLPSPYLVRITIA